MEGQRACDNTAVGVLAWDAGKLLLIERKKDHRGFGPPAGHLDGALPAEAAIRTLATETGLVAGSAAVRLVTTLSDPCRRPGGTHHVWTIVDVGRWHGALRARDPGTADVFWADPVTLADLAERLEQFAVAVGVSTDDLPALVWATNHDPDWQRNPGLDPSWFRLLKACDVLGQVWEQRPHVG